MSNPHVTGQVIRMISEHNLAIVATEEGEVRVHMSKAAGKWQHFADHATVKVEWTTEYNSRAKNDDDLYRKVATRVIEVTPAEEFVVLTKIAFVNPDNRFAWVVVGESFTNYSAYLPSKVWEAAGMGRIGEGMPLKAVVVEGWKGPVVTSFEWGRKIEAEYAEKYRASAEAVSETGTLLWFNKGRRVGLLECADGARIKFHLNGVKDKLKGKFFNDSRFGQGARFEFTVGEHRGEPTALVAKLVEPAPKQVVGNNGEAIARLMESQSAETQDATNQQSTEVNEVVAEANAEAAAEESPKPKKPRAKKPAEAKGAAPKVEAKPKRAPKVKKAEAETPLEASSLPDGPMAEQFRSLGLNGSGSSQLTH